MAVYRSMSKLTAFNKGVAVIILLLYIFSFLPIFTVLRVREFVKYGCFIQISFLSKCVQLRCFNLLGLLVS